MPKPRLPSSRVGTADMARVSLENVSKVFPGSIRALDSCELEVRDGELLVLIGPSGCGKTTLLRLVAGLESLTSGRVCLDGQPVQTLTPGARNVAMVFQGQALYPQWTVRQNLEFACGQPVSWRNRWKRRAAEPPATAPRVTMERVVQRLRLEPLLQRFPRQLSAGEQQRVAIGKVLVRNPRVFLFDEPFSHLDPPLRASLRRELKRLHEEAPVTTIYVTHDFVEALSFGGRVAVLHAGRVEQIGLGSEVYASPAHVRVAQFLGDPPINLLPGRLRRDGAQWCVEGAYGQLPVAAEAAGVAEERLGREVLYGMRPEHVLGALPGTADIPVHGPRGRVVNGEHGSGRRWLEVRLEGQNQTVWAAEMAGPVPLQAGNAVQLGFRGAHAILFDPQSGRNWAYEERLNNPKVLSE